MTPVIRASACRFAFSAVAALAFTASMIVPSSAQMRERMKDKMMDNAADQMVTTISGDSCADFATMMQGQKSGTGDSSKSGMLKKDPAARKQFVDKVAGPLLNKMIDCDLLPGK